MRFLSVAEGIMPRMDDTSLDRLVSDLEEADPADAPDIADAIAVELADQLDGPDEEAAPDPAP